MLYREFSMNLPERISANYGVSVGKNEVSTLSKQQNNQGLYLFSMLNYAPKYDNALPLYFQTGLVYKGLIPGRDADQCGVAFGFGDYSYYQILAHRAAGLAVQQTYEAVVEFDYRVQLTRFAYVQPFLQYLIQPNGIGLIKNATILGLHMGMNF